MQVLDYLCASKGAPTSRQPPGLLLRLTTCWCASHAQVLGYLYSSTGYQDELAYAAAMLYKVTGRPSLQPPGWPVGWLIWHGA